MKETKTKLENPETNIFHSSYSYVSIEVLVYFSSFYFIPSSIYLLQLLVFSCQFPVSSLQLLASSFQLLASTFYILITISQLLVFICQFLDSKFYFIQYLFASFLVFIFSNIQFYFILLLVYIQFYFIFQLYLLKNCSPTFSVSLVSSCFLVLFCKIFVYTCQKQAKAKCVSFL